MFLGQRGLLQIDLNLSGANEIAKRSRGTPRIANRLLKRVQGFCSGQEEAEEWSSCHLIREKPLSGSVEVLFEIDHRGLDAMDRRFLQMIIEKFEGGPVGIETLIFSPG